VRLRSLLAAAHLSLVERVACGNCVLVSRHCATCFALLEEGASHRLLSFLARGGRVDHLLRFEQKFVHAILAFSRSASTHPMYIVGVDGQLLRIDEFVDHRLAVSGRWVAHQASMVRSLRIVPHRHLLSRGSSCKFRLDLATPRLALRATSNRH